MILPAIFGLIALIALFFKLPAAPEILSFPVCRNCSMQAPFLPMLGAAYFAGFISVILSFRTLPPLSLKWSGLIWAVGLAIGLSYFDRGWCTLCLTAHGCHILMWLLWKPTETSPEKLISFKVALSLTSAIAMAALFISLNLALLILK